MRISMISATTGLVLNAAVGVALASAQGTGGASLVGQTKASPGCPAVEIHITREGSQLSGLVFNRDGSGVSRVNGELNGSTFHWHDTPISGNGPTGDVSRTVTPQGILQSAKTGTPCSFDKVLPIMNENSN